MSHSLWRIYYESYHVTLRWVINDFYLFSVWSSLQLLRKWICPMMLIWKILLLDQTKSLVLIFTPFVKKLVSFISPRYRILPARKIKKYTVLTADSWWRELGCFDRIWSLPWNENGWLVRPFEFIWTVLWLKMDYPGCKMDGLFHKLDFEPDHRPYKLKRPSKTIFPS